MKTVYIDAGHGGNDAGAILWDYPVKIVGVLTAGIEVDVYTNSAHTGAPLATSVSDSTGYCHFALTAGTNYFVAIYNGVAYYDSEVIS